MEDMCDMITAYGHRVYYDDPSRTPVDTEDIRRATANICRYAGHLDWKLVQHLDLTARLARLHYPNSDLAAAYAAAHDFHEIYVVDVVSGLKKHLPGYAAIESNWEQYVHAQIQLPWKHRPHDQVHYCDMRALVLEMYALQHPGYRVVAKQFGGSPSTAEKNIMRQVRAKSLAECWDSVWKTITEGKSLIVEEYGETHGRENRDCE